MAVKEFAVARPKSLWKCTLIGAEKLFLISVINSRVKTGVKTPTVSGTSKKSAPASTTELKTSNKKSLSVLVASSAENSTVKPWSLAYSTAFTAVSKIACLDIFNL